MTLDSAIKIVGRRVLRRPMTADLLLRYSAGLIAKPPFPPGYREIYDITITADGRDLMDVWRDEYTKTVQDVANQPTWPLQKKKLLWHLVKEAGWLALADAITEEQDTRSWSSFIEDVDFFCNVDDKHRLFMLTQRKLLSLPIYATLYTVGVAAYGLTSKDASALDLYKKHRNAYIDTFVRLLDGHHRWRRIDPNGAEHYRQMAFKMGPLIKELSDSTVKIGDSIVEGNLDFASAQNEVSRLKRENFQALIFFDLLSKHPDKPNDK